jgi:hypothetical protein
MNNATRFPKEVIKQALTKKNIPSFFRQLTLLEYVPATSFILFTVRGT